jgi:hypothetical protein
VAWHIDAGWKSPEGTLPMLFRKGVSESVPRRGSAPSSEKRARVRVAAGLEVASRAASKFGVRRIGPVRCWRVDLLRLCGRRTGELGGGIELSRSSCSTEVPCAPSTFSKMLKSVALGECRLLRFELRGLPNPAVSRFITPSLRFSGLDFIDAFNSRRVDWNNATGVYCDERSAFAGASVGDSSTFFVASSEQSMFS